jgi:hypothetical protein
MVDPLTPKPTRKAEALAKAPPTIASRREEDVALKKWPKPWLEKLFMLCTFYFFRSIATDLKENKNYTER